MLRAAADSLEYADNEIARLRRIEAIVKDIVRVRNWGRGDADDEQLGPQDRAYLSECINRFGLPAGRPGSMMNIKDATVARLGLLFLRAAHEIEAMEYERERQ
jgi:hypothetical protein